MREIEHEAVKKAYEEIKPSDALIDKVIAESKRCFKQKNLIQLCTRCAGAAAVFLASTAIINTGLLNLDEGNLPVSNGEGFAGSIFSGGTSYVIVGGIFVVLCLLSFYDYHRKKRK